MRPSVWMIAFQDADDDHVNFPISFPNIKYETVAKNDKQGWVGCQIYEYEYKYLSYVWVRIQVRDYYMSTSPSTGWWVRVRVRANDNSI